MTKHSTEQFDIFDETGQPLGTRARHEVHRLGYWHRSAQLFLHNKQGAILVHQRAASKDLYASLWDHSVGEHLQPGESYAAGATRGVREELGLTNLTLRPLGQPRKQEFQDPAGEWWDRELLQSFIAIYDPAQHGTLTLDAAEVAATAWWDAATVKHWLQNRRHELTPWFADDQQRHNLWSDSPDASE